jgi:protein TonB
LLLIPLIYTDRLPFTPLTLPVFLLPPVPPPELPKQDVAHVTHVTRIGKIFVPSNIPPLDTRPEIAVIVDDAVQIGPGTSIPEIARFVTSLPLGIPPPPTITAVETAPAKPITVTSDMQAAKLLRKVVPVYPRPAIAARVSGTVRLIGTIGKDGTLQQIQVVSGPGLLVQAAVDAVRQWLYRPTMLGGKPVEVIAPIDVNFTLSQ